ncbi:WxL domain-containing protein [Patescibacteria group bacterium]|nr:WxL domain-containing protein [Patescibacteria group bacterium]
MSQVKREIKTIKKQIISVLILFFMFVMIFATVNLGLAANNADTNLAQNIISGTLDMTAPGNLNWTNVILNGSNQNSNTNLDGVNVTDYRGGGGTGWNLTLYAENNITAGTNNIDITARLNVAPGDVTSDDTAQSGSNFMMPNDSGNAEVLMNAGADCGTGVSNIDNTLFKLLIESGDAAGDYTAVMVFTVSS